MILILLIVIYICLLLVSPPRYYSFLPSLKVYPDNEKEAKEVEEETKQKTYFDVMFFKKTDPSISYAFHELLPQYSVGELNHIISNVSFFVYSLKYSINRARPHQIRDSIDVLESKTASTPSYPAGHAFQAYYLAKYLTKKHPEKEKELNALAEKCDLVRVKAGLHYPSDGQFSKRMVQFWL